jgi:hypothetical protein
MIRWTRSARIAPGKFMEAMQWAKEIAEFISKKHGVQTTVYLDSFGEYGTIRWFADHADLATLEKFGYQIFADQEYLQRVNRGTDLIMVGSVFDTVMRAI